MSSQNKDMKINEMLKGSFLWEHLRDDRITDISWNGTSLYIQHNEKGRFRPNNQPTLEQAEKLIKQIANIQEKEFTDTAPILDAEIDYIRVNAVHQVISKDGLTFALRISRPRLAIADLNDLVNEEAALLMELLMRTKSNMFISGETGSGKTELQKLLVGFIPDMQKITLIEDTRDSHIKALYPDKDINSWQTLKDFIDAQTLLQASLRNNPDWVILTETRGKESGDMMDIAKSNHAVIVTLHSIDSVNIPSRLRTMVKQSPAYANSTDSLIIEEIITMFNFGIHMDLSFENGKFVRRIKEIVEYIGFDETGLKYEYVYNLKNVYIEETDSYELKEFMKPISQRTKDRLIDKKLYHLLPNVFKGKSEK
ncbi:type II/IV secretion system ATPase subunit [Bacillus thuringiensis]|uniref:ATPase, T2SS/T4P/T4SS family n=1 Tax=Bacillus thuringiensis TaxID=1428 RepID=UPI0028540820|nr:ATPase, T2SS/T4P/T4SS family [Bacillus thuringiensis]MDR5021415.1 type II/IV secretion system ATPase subunit [Bacillus thuringiensis]